MKTNKSVIGKHCISESQTFKWEFENPLQTVAYSSISYIHAILTFYLLFIEELIFVDFGESMLRIEWTSVCARNGENKRCKKTCVTPACHCRLWRKNMIVKLCLIRKNIELIHFCPSSLLVKVACANKLELLNL